MKRTLVTWVSSNEDCLKLEVADKVSKTGKKMSRIMDKAGLKKTSPNMGNSNALTNEENSWSHAYDAFSNVLDRKTIQIKSLSETIDELDALKKLTQDASTEVLNATTIFINGAISKKKFLSPDQINSQIREIMDAESLLLETRLQVQTVDDVLNVEVLRDIRKRFLQAVNRAESLSMDIRNDRTLLSEIEEDISLAIKKARATTQLNNAREEALKCGHELEALTRARRKLVSAIEKAESVDLDVSSELSVAEGLESALEEARESKRAQSNLQKVMSKAQSVPTDEKVDAMSKVQSELSSAIDRANAAGIATDDAKKIQKDFQKDVAVAKENIKAKEDAFQVLQSAFSEAKSVSEDNDFAFVRSVKKQLDIAIQEARQWDIDVKTEESLTKEMAKSIDAAERKNQANKQLKAAHHRFKSLKISDDVDLLSDIHEEMKAAIHRASRTGIDVTDDRVKARELKLRIGVIQNLNEARNQLENARKKSEKVSLDASSRTLQKIARQLSSAIELAQASGMDEQKGYFGTTLLKPDRDRLERIIDAINVAKQKENAQRQLSLARKKATTLPNGSSEDSVREIREELLKAIDNANKTGLEVSEGMLGSRPLNTDQRLLENLDGAEEFANKVAAVRKELSFLSVEVQSLDEDADIGKLQELGNSFKEAVMKGAALGLKVSGEKKLLNDLNGAIDLSEKRVEAISELTEVQELARSLPKKENLESQQILRDRFERAVNNARSVNVETTDAQIQLSLLNSKVSSATDKMATEIELKQAQEMADSLSSNASRVSLVKTRGRLVAAAERGKTAGINISGGYFGKSVITVAEEKINDLAKDIELLDHRTEAKKHLLNVRKEAKSLDLKGNDESLLHKVRDKMASALEKAINVGISTDEDEKLLDGLEQALSKLIREKSDSSKALESSLNNAQSASVEEGLEKLKEIRENLISAISWAEELGLDITANKMIFGELSEKIEKTRERTQAESKLHTMRGKVKDNLSEPHLKTLLTLRRSLSSAIENGELAGLDVSRDKDLSSDLEAAITIARERNEVEANLNSVRSKADAALPENGSIAVKAVHDKLKESMVQGDSLGVDLRGDNDRLENLAVIIDQAEERERALNQLKELKQEAEAASGDEAKLGKFRDKLISSIERCTAAGVVDVSSENLLVDELNQEISAIRERANAEIELREALHASDEDSSNLNLEVLTSKRDRLSAAIDRAQLSAIDVSNEMDKLNELENSVLKTVENAEAELQIANVRESVKQSSSDDNPTVLRSLHNSLGNAVERAEKVGIEVAEDHQTLRDLEEKIDCADELNKVQEIAEEVIPGIDSQSIEEALNTLQTVIERADTLGLQTDKYQVLSNEMKTTLERLAQEKVEAQEALSAARLQEQVLSEDSDPAMIEKTRDALLDAVHQADSSGIDVAEDQVKVDQLDEMAKRAREKLEAKEQLIKAREDVEAIFMDEDPDALSVVHKFLIAAVGRASYCEIDVKQDEKRIEELEDAISFARSRQEAKTELLKAREFVKSLPEGSDIVTLRNSRDQLLQAITHGESLQIDVSSYQEDIDQLDKAVDKAEEEAKAYEILDESSPHTNLAESYDVFNTGESASSDESSSVGQLSDENDKTEYYHGQNEISIIDDVNVLKEFSNHTRKAIVQCLYTIPRYPEEIAKEINFPREKIYYHLRKLLYVNLIFVADTKVINGISKKKYLNIARSFQISPSLYESQLFVETGFPIAENPEAMKEKKTTAQSSALPTIDEKEEIKEPVASDSEEDEFIYDAPKEIEDAGESTPDEAQLDEEKEIQKTKADSEDQGELIHDSTDVQESNNEDMKEDEESLIEDNDNKTVEDTPSDDVQQKVQQQVVVEKIVVEQKPQKIVVEQKPQKIVIEQKPQHIVVEQKEITEEGQNQEKGVNTLLTTLLSSQGEQTADSGSDEIEKGTQESLEPALGSVEKTPLTKSFTIDDQKYLVPEFELTPEGIDLAVRNARKAGGEMMTVEEKTLLRDHLLSLRMVPTLYDESDSLEGTLNLSERGLIDPAEQGAKSPLVTFFQKRVINYYRRLKGFTKVVTIIKSRDKVTLLMADVKGDSFVISKAKSYELPYETEDVLIEELPQFIHYIYEQEIAKKAWNKYYLGLYASDYPIETDFVTVPKMSKDELSMFLGNQIAERFSVEKDKVVMNWLSYVGEEKEETEITSCCLFMDREAVSQGYDFLLKRGIQTRYITSILKVQFNIYKNQCKDTSSGDAILIYFGHKKTRVTIVNNWKIISSRELLMGLENYVQGYRDTAFTVEESQEMTYNEICNLFFETGLPAPEDDPKKEDEEESVSGSYDEIINSVTSKYLSEIYATLRNFKLKGMRMGGEFYGSGPGIAIPNILEIVSRSVDKDIEPLDIPLETMLKQNFEGELAPEDRQYFIQNLGLILDPAEELSLLPEEHRNELKWFLPSRVVQIAMGIIFSVTTLYTALSYNSIKEVETQVPPKKLELQTATAHQSEYLTYFKDLQAVKGFLSVQEYDRTAGRKIIYLLQYLTNIASDRIVMDSISSKAVDAPPQNNIRPVVLTLLGKITPPKGETKIILNNFIYLLKNSDHVNKVSLIQSLDMGEGSLSFSIETEL